MGSQIFPTSPDSVDAVCPGPSHLEVASLKAT